MIYVIKQFDVYDIMGMNLFIRYVLCYFYNKLADKEGNFTY